MTVGESLEHVSRTDDIELFSRDKFAVFPTRYCGNPFDCLNECLIDGRFHVGEFVVSARQCVAPPVHRQRSCVNRQPLLSAIFAY